MAGDGGEGGDNGEGAKLVDFCAERFILRLLRATQRYAKSNVNNSHILSIVSALFI